MNITKNLTTVNRTVYESRPIQYIVLHYFGALGSAKDTCAYFKSVNRHASAHYFVDDAGVWQCVEDRNAAWHCGDSGKGTLKGLCRNYNSIGIELRPYITDPARKADATFNGWYFHEKTIENAVALTRTLMEKYGVDAAHVVRHYDVTGKWCPRPWMGGDQNAYYGVSGNELWRRFKEKLTAKEDDKMLSYEEFKSYMSRYEAERGAAAPGAWSREARDWAESEGLMQGAENGWLQYKLPVTREQMAVFMMRFWEKLKR